MSSAKPSCSRPSMMERLSRMRMTIFSPYCVGSVRDAQIDVPAVDHGADAAVLGQAAFGDVEVGHDLEARDDGGVHVAAGFIASNSTPSMR